MSSNSVNFSFSQMLTVSLRQSNANIDPEEVQKALEGLKGQELNNDTAASLLLFNLGFSKDDEEALNTVRTIFEGADSYFDGQLDGVLTDEQKEKLASDEKFDLNAFVSPDENPELYSSLEEALALEEAYNSANSENDSTVEPYVKDDRYDIIPQYENASWADMLSTRAATTNMAEIPDGFTLTSSAKGFYKCNGESYRKINPALLSNYSANGLHTDCDMNIRNEQGEIVGLAYKNKDGSVSFYLKTSVSKNTEISTSKISTKSSEASVSTDATTQESSKSISWNGQKTNLEQLGYTFENGYILSPEGKKVGSYTSDIDGNIENIKIDNKVE